jgi:heme/copper-type cytochrome/quinol oxidase subunit 1
MRFASDHKTIGLRYLWLALLSVFVGMALSLLLRFGVVWPGGMSLSCRTLRPYSREMERWPFCMAH